MVDHLINKLPFLSYDFEIGEIRFNKEAQDLIFRNRDNSIEYLSINIPYQFKGYTSTKGNSPSECHTNLYGDKELKEMNNSFEHSTPHVCAQFDKNISCLLQQDTVTHSDLLCHSIEINSMNKQNSIINCIQLSANWYGGGLLSDHRWPLNRANIPMQPFLTRRNNISNNGAYFGPFLEPVFISSTGVAILIDDSLPLFISIAGDQSELCLKSSFEKPYTNVDNHSKNLSLKYRVCRSSTSHTGKAILKQLWKSNILLYPKKSPNTSILQKPVWSSRGVGSRIQNQTNLINFTKNIINYNLSCSLLMVDGNYSRASGLFFFHERRFSHSQQLINELLVTNKMHVGTEVFPYISAQDVQFSIQNDSKAEPPLILDMTNKNSVELYQSHLQDVRTQVNVAGFRFSGGHAFDFLSFVEKRKITSGENRTLPQFNSFTRLYSNIAAKFEGFTFIGSGYKSQLDGLVADIGPLGSTWSHHLGLKSLLPQVLTQGLLGYPFVMTGPIGGLTTSSQAGSLKNPDKELYIRWLQVSVFFPIVEFSVGPWEYDIELVNYTKKLLQFRSDELWPRHISKALNETLVRGGSLK